MDKNFSDKEKLYRAVMPATRFPNFWKKNGKVSSAAFKKKDGLSVERGNFRADKDIINEMKQFFTGSIVSVSVKECKDVDAVIKYLPTERSNYHSEIHRNSEIKPLTESQAKHLADKAIIVYKEQ